MDTIVYNLKSLYTSLGINMYYRKNRKNESLIFKERKVLRLSVI